MAERLPSEVYVSNDMRSVQPHSNHHFNSYEVDSHNGSCIPSHKYSTLINDRERVISDGSSLSLENITTSFVNGNEDEKLIDEHSSGIASSGVTESADEKEVDAAHSENVSSTKSAMVAGNSHVETEWTEKYEHGVYVVSLQDGKRELKMFSFR